MMLDIGVAPAAGLVDGEVPGREVTIATMEQSVEPKYPVRTAIDSDQSSLFGLADDLMPLVSAITGSSS
jgi:hypothetical protein